MGKRLKKLAMIFLLLPCFLSGKEKLAQTGFQFLFVKSNARASAMGEAMTAIEGNSSALFFNPATMALMDKRLDINFSNNKWIADIEHNVFSLSVKPATGIFGVFGFSLQAVDYGEMQGTATWANGEGYYDTEVFNPTALSLGIGYAKCLNDKLSIGAHIKSAYQYLGKSVTVIGKNDSLELKNENERGIAFDFGTYLKTGFKSLAFGMSVNNFSQELKYEQEGFQVPLNFTLGISMDIMDFISTSSKNNQLLLAIDATHPRSHAEQVKIGVDYTLMKLLSLRCGYIYGNDENDISFGIGLKKFGLGVDYALIPFGVFGYVNQFSVSFSL